MQYISNLLRLSGTIMLDEVYKEIQFRILPYIQLSEIMSIIIDKQHTFQPALEQIYLSWLNFGF